MRVIHLESDSKGIYFTVGAEVGEITLIIVNYRNLEGASLPASIRGGKIYLPDYLAKTLDFRPGDKCKVLLRWRYLER